MERIGIYDARAKLSELVDRVQAGEEVTLTRRGEPVARLVPVVARSETSRAAAVKAVRALSKRLQLDIRPAELRKAISGNRD